MSCEVVAAVVIALLLTTPVHCGVECHHPYIRRGRADLCCLPVFNCLPGNYIEPCQTMNGSDICRECPQDYVQPNFISSLDNDTQCFRKQAECTARDLTYSKRREYCYPRDCKCNTYQCYQDDHCVCVKVPPCPVNQTLDSITGKCQACPKFSYKDEIGCGPCITDVRAWMDHQHRQEEEENKCDKRVNRIVRQFARRLKRVKKMLRRKLTKIVGQIGKISI